MIIVIIIRNNNNYNKNHHHPLLLLLLLLLLVRILLLLVVRILLLLLLLLVLLLHPPPPTAIVISCARWGEVVSSAACAFFCEQRLPNDEVYAKACWTSSFFSSHEGLPDGTFGKEVVTREDGKLKWVEQEQKKHAFKPCQDTLIFVAIKPSGGFNCRHVKTPGCSSRLGVFCHRLPLRDAGRFAVKHM